MAEASYEPRTELIQNPSQMAYTSFTYQPLDASVDSIRLMKLDGDPDSDEVSCELIHSTFASKPKYDALSYTWGSPETIKTIKIDGHEVKVRENLYWALINLRKVMIQQLLWVDAICINQNDLEERNHQVGLMAFIYSRAQSVLVWLGRPIFHPLEMQQIQLRIEEELVIKLHDVDYWRRVWIVQEIGLARKIAFIYEFNKRPVTSEWDCFMKTLEDRVSRENQAPETILPLKLKKLRDGRHGDMNNLEHILNTFTYSECQEPRDKIYGFLGLAHDCQEGTIKVDYSKSVVDIYKEVIAFQYNSTPLESPLPPEIDRIMRLVRFSDLVQRMFEGRVDEEIKKLSLIDDNLLSPVYRVRGLMQGCIIHLGPSYSDTVSSFEAEKRWKTSLEQYYKKSAELSQLRKQDESYTVRLVEMTDADVAKICSFESSPSRTRHTSWSCYTDWLRNTRYEKSDDALKDRLSKPASISPLYEKNNPQEPRRFLGSNSFMGLAPGDVKLGDMIFRFWGCDVAALFRHKRGIGPCIVGRVDVSTPWEETEQQPVYYPGPYNNLETGGVMLIDLDIHTLQMLTR